MKTVAIITRRLKEGKTYEDFRKAWFHRVGFGTPSKLYTMMNVFDPSEIIVIGFAESDLEQMRSALDIEVKQRLENPLDDIVEPQIHRQFGILISEDDFSACGSIEYKPATIGGEATNLQELPNQIEKVSGMIAEASRERDSWKRPKTGP